ncbi:MAG: response regulator [Anaerolineae bacterium]|nr:response regulator [Anaerolineae bacterium]
MSESKPIRVLYMEDDDGLARLLQKKLQQAGCEVDIAPDGEQGLAMYNAGSYDVVAVDQNMPIHSGLEVIRIMATEGALPPMIMVTGTGDEETAVEAMKLGAGDYIVKDVDGGYLELLPTVVGQVLQQRRLAEEKRRAVEALEQRNRDLTLLNNLGQSLTATLDMQQVIDRLLHAVTEIIGAEGGSVWLWDEEREGWLICRGALHHGLSQSLINLRLCPGEGIASWVAKTGKSTTVPYAPTDRRFSPNIDARTGYHTTSLLAMPLRVRDAVIGVLEVVNKKVGDFTEADCSLIETLAASGAIAIDNAHLVETLRQQTAELQARNEDLNAFAHTVAHDLKTPLGVIVGYADVLMEEWAEVLKESEDARYYLQSIARNGRKMANIIGELLLLAEIRRIEVQHERLDMANVVSEAVQRLAFLSEEKGAEIVVPDTWPAAVGYSPWIEEVWVNYLSNGIKYGGQPPRLELGATVQDDGFVRFWVRDQGPGISPEDQTRLFTPFTQLEQVRATGHGLGLSIVRRIVEKLGGEVGVESEVGEGSKFSFTLPAR